jgi:PKD repeat protein
MRNICVFIFLTLQGYVFSDTGIPFKENKGQWPGHVLFAANYKTTSFFVNTDGFSFCILDGNDLKKGHDTKYHSRFTENEPDQTGKCFVKGHNYSVTFNKASFSSVTKPAALKEYYNYFLGNDEKTWVGDVKAFEHLLFNNIYKNIDLRLYSNNDDLKYDLIIKPHADVTQLELTYENTGGLSLKNGSLVVQTSVGVVVEQKPFAYQIIKGVKTEVACEYVLKTDRTVTYNITGNYNANNELVIDPTVVVCSYSGSHAWSNCNGASYDAAGNIFVFGTSEAGYPVTTGAFQMAFDSIYDNTITKYDATGSNKLFSTYLGGSRSESIQNIVVTQTAITVFGRTNSPDFPVTANAFDKVLNDTTTNITNDLFLCRLNLAGSSLLASTYVGGSANEGINILTSTGTTYSEFNFTGNMVVDAQENVYMSSCTASADFPVSANAFQPFKLQGFDNVAVKFDPTLSTMLYGTFFGGSGQENALYCKLVNNNELLITGTTGSNNFPTTPGVISPTKSPGNDMYVFHLNSSGSGIIASTFLGTGANDFAYMLDSDLNNDIYICGSISNTGMLTSTPGLYSNPTGRNTIYKINSALSSVIYKTKFGTAQRLECTAFKIDSCQNIYIAGITDVPGFPVSLNKFQDYKGSSDLYIAMFNTNMIALAFGSYFGGKNDEHTDGGTSSFSPDGILYHGICIHNGDLPVTGGAYQTTIPTSDSTFYNDAFLKADMQSFVKATSSYGAEITGCAPFNAQFNSFPNTGTVTWDFGDGSPLSSQQNTTHLYNSVGQHTVQLVASDTGTCNKTDTVQSLLKVINQSNLAISGNTFLCNNSPVLLTAQTSDTVTYNWSTGATTSSISVQSAGMYSVIINNGGCDTQQSVEIRQLNENINDVFPNVVTPNNDKVNDAIDLKTYGLTEVNFTVYDRWGHEKFKTEKTDAVFSGSDYADGTYYYSLNYKTNCSDTVIRTRGFITVFR